MALVVETSAVPKTKAAPAEEHEQITIGPPILTKYEKARVIGARALQISMGAPVIIEAPPEMRDPLQLAQLEMPILPLTIRRKLPDGRFQEIPLKWLLAASSAS